MWWYVNVYRKSDGSLYSGAITTMQDTIKLRAVAVQRMCGHELVNTLKIKPKAGYKVSGCNVVKIK